MSSPSQLQVALINSLPFDILGAFVLRRMKCLVTKKQIEYLLKIVAVRNCIQLDSSSPINLFSELNVLPRALGSALLFLAQEGSNAFCCVDSFCQSCSRCFSCCKDSLTSAGNFLYVKEKTWGVAVFPSGVHWAEDEANNCLLPYAHLIHTCALSVPSEICPPVASASRTLMAFQT